MMDKDLKTIRNLIVIGHNISLCFQIYRLDGKFSETNWEEYLKLLDKLIEIDDEYNLKFFEGMKSEITYTKKTGETITEVK